MRIERCSTPRPYTVQTPSSGAFTTRRARLRSSSFSRRSAIWRDVTNFPSRPKKGESLLVKVIDMVGSSIAMRGSASGVLMSAIVSPISNPSIPTRAQISPEAALSTFVRPIPSKIWSSLIRCFTVEPSRLQRTISCPSCNSPRCMRPMAIRPTYEEKSSEVMSICEGPSIYSGAGICSMIVSSSTEMLSVGLRQSVDIQFCLA